MVKKLICQGHAVRTRNYAVTYCRSCGAKTQKSWIIFVGIAVVAIVAWRIIVNVFDF